MAEINANNHTVLIVHNYYKFPGGEDTVVQNEIRLLEKHGYRVYFYSRRNNEIDGFSFIRKALLPVTMFFNLKTFFDVKRIINKKNIEIVHVHNTLNLISPSVYYAALLCKRPIVQTLHNFRFICPSAILYRNGKVCEECISSGFKKALIHGCYRNSKIQTLILVACLKLHFILGVYDKLNYICLTEFNKNKLLSSKYMKGKRIFLKSNFVVDSAIMIPAEKRKEQFVFVGRLEAIKGIQFLLNAWRSLNDIHEKLIIIGDGPLKEWCNEFIKSNSIKNIELLGFQRHDKALNIIAESKALVFTSECYEGLPVSIIESYSVGTPVICPDFGNHGLIVKEGITGLHYKFKSEKSFERATLKMKDKYQDYVSNCRKEYLENYNEDKNYEILEKIYNVLLKEE